MQCWKVNKSGLWLTKLGFCFDSTGSWGAVTRALQSHHLLTEENACSVSQGLVFNCITIPFFGAEHKSLLSEFDKVLSLES